MRSEYYYANFPTKLHQQNFKSKKDRNLHLLAMSIIIGWVNTSSGRFYLSARKLADELDCSIKKAKEIISNFVKWGFLKKISHAVNQHKKSVYELSTYNWNLETAKETATETAPNKEYQALEQNSETATETANFHQTNNDLTNNDITKNENNKEEEMKEKENKTSSSSSADSDFELEEITDLNETEEVLYDAYMQTFNAICPEKRIIAITPKRQQALNEAEKILEKAGVGWKEACQQFRDSTWIYQRPYATFDWFINVENLVKVLEGRYIETANTHSIQTEPQEPQQELIEKTYSLSVINGLKTNKYTKHHYETDELLQLLRQHFVKTEGDKVYINAPAEVHQRIEDKLQFLTPYLKTERRLANAA